MGFRNRKDAQEWITSHQYPLVIDGLGYSVILILSGISRTQLEVRDMPIDAGGVATRWMGYIHTDTDPVAAAHVLEDGHHTFKKHADVKLAIGGAVVYELHANNGGGATGVDIYWIPIIMGMEGGEAAAAPPEMFKLQGTVRHARNGVTMLTFLVAKHWNLTCAGCNKKGHTANSVLCADNAAGFVAQRANEYNRRREDRKRAREEA